ncbi:hypothetical protein D0U00_04280 [Leclercia adecarboxylata]|uniref:hypothetical protein n=1 Tax=Leclercia adecarboxylata TaxID=83655 RepID=UPI000E3CD889|nr:hypothetical protein [Leclercia adecarboxylata]RFS80614.1 hypothetical protein D0U00_04280 [Leclercia adecarboxylata]
MSIKRYEVNGSSSVFEDESGSLVDYQDYAALEAKCAALAAECHGFKRFFMFAINAAFDGCDITGDQIQEVAKEIGLVRVEPYSEAKHAEMSGDPSVMEEGDDFYIMNKTPATDSFRAEVRAQGVDAAIEHLSKKFEGAGHIGVPVMALEWLAQELRKGASA